MKLIEVLQEAKRAGFKGVDDGVVVWSIDCFSIDCFSAEEAEAPEAEAPEYEDGEYFAAYDLQRTRRNRVRIDCLDRDGYRRPTTWWLVR